LNFTLGPAPLHWRVGTPGSEERGADEGDVLGLRKMDGGWRCGTVLRMNVNLQSLQDTAVSRSIIINTGILISDLVLLGMVLLG
jgi:hypothetical protein